MSACSPRARTRDGADRRERRRQIDHRQDPHRHLPARTSGEIRVGGDAGRFASPRDAWAAGIAAIHQETVMFDELTRRREHLHGPHADAVGTARRLGRRCGRARRELLERIDAPIPPDLPAQAPVGRAEASGRDRPRARRTRRRSSSWTSRRRRCRRNEIDDLFRIVAQLKAEGRAIVFISHKFDEIFRIADDFVCLRDGEKVGEGPIASVTEPQLVRMMVGRPVDQVFPEARRADRRRRADGRGAVQRDRISPTSPSTLRKGEILGLYGLVGAGRTGGDAGPVRHDADDAGQGDARRQAARDRARRPTRSRPAFPTCRRTGRTRARSCRSASART